jgi:DNA-binding NtrC family response regulator
VLGFGSTFTVFLPFVPSAPGPLSFSNVPERAIRGSETILVVEDEESFRTMISDALRSNGYTVLECQDGTNCIELAASYDKPIDLMLTDVMLPDVTGGRVAEVILNSRPSMEVLYMSGYTDEYITDLGILRPETTFLEKPFDLDLMLRAVRKALDGARANFPVAELPSSSPFPNP